MAPNTMYTVTYNRAEYKAETGQDMLDIAECLTGLALVRVQCNGTEIFNGLAEKLIGTINTAGLLGFGFEDWKEYADR